MILSTRIRAIAKRLEFDNAVLFGISAKVWTTIAGPVTAIIIISHFSLPLQGYYYTFSSLLALQVFAEMGLGAVTQQFASHEWSKLTFSEDRNIVGDPGALSRLISLFKVSLKWFLIGGGIVFTGLLISGYFFFSSSANYHIQWLAPWICISVLTGIDIMFVPFWSLLEGCNQVKQLYGFRVLQGILLNICIWSSIVSGAGLWAICIGSAVSISSAFIFIRLKYYNFFKTLIFGLAQGEKISWQKDLLPMQWRIAVSWISGFLCSSLFTPFLFKYHGPAIAGKFGMTWSVLGALTGIANAWVTPKVPLFAIYAAQGNYYELDKLFFKIVKIVFFVLLTLSICAWVFVYILPFVKIKYAAYLAGRLISPLPFGILLAAQTILYTSSPFSSYLRAHKIEPLMYISVIQSLFVAFFTLLLSPKYSVLGIAVGYLISMSIGFPVVIMIWRKYRARWIAKTIL